MSVNHTSSRTFSDDMVRAIVGGGGRIFGAQREEFRSRLSEWADADLDSGRGFFVLTGLDALEERHAREFTLAASETLGRVMPQSFDGEFVREVKDRGRSIESDSSARYSDTRFGGNMHTDGMHREGHVPDYFTLYCVRPARLGGELLLVDVADLSARLDERPDILSTLRLDFFFDTRAADIGLPQTVRRPILEESHNGTRVHYFREYIESGQRKSGRSALTAKQMEALEFVDAVVADPSLQQTVRADCGEMLFINNARLIHGRTDFTDDPETTKRRLLFRTWIDASARTSARGMRDARP